MSAVVLEFIVILLLVVLNGFFSMAEIALLTCRRSRMSQLAADGDPRARIVLQLIEDRPRLLSTIQSGVSLVGIVTGVLGGTTLANGIEGQLAGLGLPGWLSSVLGFLVAVFAVTYIAVIAGELIPKQIAASDGEGTALRLARVVLFLSRVLAPAAGVLSRSSAAVLRFFHVTLPAASRMGHEEIKVLIDEGIEGGRLRPGEGRLVRSAVSFTEKRVWELMTPRSEVVWLEKNAPAEEIRGRLAETRHSRFPVCEGGLDAVVGVVRAKDILDGREQGERAGFELSMTPAVFVPLNALAPRVLERMRAERSDLALAVDEFGIFQGLVTVHDVLRALAGEGPSTHGAEDGMAVQLPDRSWLMEGLLEAGRFRQILSVSEAPAANNCRTLGGIIMSQLGRVPAPGDEVTVGGMRVEVSTMVGNRVGKVRVTERENEELA